MKKFLSVLLTMAMVMTLFTGTVLAAAYTVIDIGLSKDKIVEGVDTAITVEVTAGTAAEGDRVYWRLVDATNYAAAVDSGYADLNAVKKFTIPTTRMEIANSERIHTYTLHVNADPINPTDDTGNQTKLITVIHKMTVNGTTNYPQVKVAETTNFNGVVNNAKNLYVAVLDNTKASVIGVKTNDQGVFNFDYTFEKAGVFYLGVGTSYAGPYEDYLAIDFEPALNLKVAKTTVPSNTRAAVPFATTITVSSDTTTALADPVANLFVEITQPDGTPVKLTNTAGYAYTANLGTGAATSLIPGTYTVTAVLFSAPVNTKNQLAEITPKDAISLRKGVTTFTVDDNRTSLLVTAKAGNNGGLLGVFDTNTDEAKFVSLIPEAGAQNQVAIVVSAPSAKQITKVSYTISGPLKASVKKTYDGGLADFDAEAVYNNLKQKVEDIDILQGGTITIKGTVTYSDKSTEDFEKTLKVDAYVVEFGELGTVGDVITLTATVKTPAGVPVNNAKVVWVAENEFGAARNAFREYDGKDYLTATNTVEVDGRKIDTNIQDGKYELNVKLVEFAKVYYTVTAPGNTPYALGEGIVYGQELYTVTGVKDIVAGKGAQNLKLKLYDGDELNITPNWGYLEDPSDLGVIYGGFAGTGEITVTLTPGVKTGAFTLLLGTKQGAQIVKVPINVVANPSTVTVNDLDSIILTAGVDNTIDVTFADKSTPQVRLVLSDNVEGTKTTVPAAANANANGFISLKIKPILTGDKTSGKIKLVANWNATGGYLVADDVTVLTFDVKLPLLDLNGVEELEISNVVDLPVVLTDANGAPIKEQVIEPSGAVLVNTTFKTDEEGKVTLTLSPNTVGKLTITAKGLITNHTLAVAPATAFDTEFAVTVPVVRDSKGPVIALEKVYIVPTASATISFKVTDTSRVAEVWVGYEKALVRPDGSTIITLSGLKAGNNEFAVLAYDEYGNASEATLVVKYSVPTKYELTIGSTEATKDGAPIVGMDQAPVIKGGRTFLPVRFVLETLMGGTMEWDANTRTITAVVDGHNIKMVIGSKVAWVDSAEIELLEAPYIESASSRTLVPLREIMEAIGYVLEWDAVTRTATILVP